MICRPPHSSGNDKILYSIQMQTVFRQILRQDNKAIKILTRLSEQHPKLGEQLDLALYACLQIEKHVNKYVNARPTREVIEMGAGGEEVEQVSCSEDALFATAMQNIENFKNSAFKFERKVNVLINESEHPHWKHSQAVKHFVKKIHAKKEEREQQPVAKKKSRRKEHISREWKAEEESDPPKPPKRHKIHSIPQSPLSEPADESSINLTACDLSILELTERIKLLQAGKIHPSSLSGGSELSLQARQAR